MVAPFMFVIDRALSLNRCQSARPAIHAKASSFPTHGESSRPQELLLCLFWVVPHGTGTFVLRVHSPRLSGCHSLSPRRRVSSFCWGLEQHVPRFASRDYRSIHMANCHILKTRCCSCLAFVNSSSGEIWSFLPSRLGDRIWSSPRMISNRFSPPPPLPLDSQNPDLVNQFANRK